MRIKAVRDNRIEIHLSGDETQKIFGGYDLIDYDEPDCRIKIHGLIAAAMPEELLPLDCRRILIEVKQKESGCIISFTKVYEKYRKAREKTQISMIFENSDCLISSLSILREFSDEKSELYNSDKRYAVIIVTERARSTSFIHISEYCTVSLSAVDAMKIREYWRPVCKAKAVSRLLEAFL